MSMSPPAALVIFDYSGTLSLEAPRFARPESLTCALAETGLAALGVATPEAYWDKIVNPTWTEGSSTTAGYRKVMAERIRSLGLAPGVPAEKIEAAAARFVERYLARSGIDPRWRPLLTHLSGRRDAISIIATDHYAETTEAIIGFLRAWNIPASRVGKAGASSDPFQTATTEIPEQPPCGLSEKGGTAPLFLPKKTGALSPLFVANSADLGAWKDDRRFWEGVKRALSLGVPRRIILVDDFGFNEQAGDRYGERSAVSLRQERTTTLLQAVFQTAAEVAPFRLAEDPLAPEDAAARLIAETAARIGSLLGMGGES